MRICDYLHVIDFPSVFHYFLRIVRYNVRLHSVLVALRFWHRFFIASMDRFRGHFDRLSGVLTGDCWHRFFCHYF